MKIPLVLSGNFGELRPDHFHSGIDIKTQGTIGHPVYSVGEGYVSRIKVQSNGYGKSIYVTHPGGYTSQYGHLDRYRDDIAAYVKDVQYRFRSHVVDLYLEPDAFPLQKGELIAYSGNTGGSSGPHLHFEVRHAADQRPTNVLKYNFDVRDHEAPRFLSLFATPLDPGSRLNRSPGAVHTRIAKDGEHYTLPYGTRITGSGNIGLSVEVFDYLDGATNRCGVYRLEMYVDGSKTFAYQMDEFSFSETRYVNAQMDYGAMIRTGVRAQRLYRLPNNRLRIYGEIRNEGVLRMEENRRYQVRIVATDVAGNTSELLFTLDGEGNGASSPEGSPAVPDGSGGTDRFRWNEYNRYEAGDVRVEIPEGALYEDLDFSFSRSPARPGAISDFYHIASRETPIHLPYTLAVRADVSDRRLLAKLLLVTLDDEGEMESAGGEYRDGEVVARLTSFGEYAVALDTLSPEIIPRHLKARDLTGIRSLQFTVKDDLSGVQKYEGYIDDQWVLFEYDPKNDLITYTFDAARIGSGKAHRLELYVTDAKGNASLYQSEFTW